MEFVDRKTEIKELERVLSPDSKPKFVVVFGRRRLGKSTLIKKVLHPSDIYYMAVDMVTQLQLDMLRTQLSVKFPILSTISIDSWEALLLMVNNLTTEQFTLCLDEFPYLVKHSPELPSILQRLIDSGELKYNLIICGSSQRMMQNMILSRSEPLFGRAQVIIDLKPIPISYMQEALKFSPINTIEEYSIWGGVPRYWELREEYSNLKEAIVATMLSSTGVLYDEPKRLFLDDMAATVQSESLMAVIAGGASRLSEIAARMGKEATALSGPLDKLLQMNYLRREIPFGESPKKSKKGIYKINDPMMDFYYSFIIPNLSNIGRGRTEYVIDEIETKINEYVGRFWEYLCREAISGNKLFGHRWKEASRWWGNVPMSGMKESHGKFREMEFDVVAESSDGTALLVGECKWTNPEVASELEKKLRSKAELLPFAKGKEIITVLFLKHPPKDKDSDYNILYPQDVINLSYGD